MTTIAETLAKHPKLNLDNVRAFNDSQEVLEAKQAVLRARLEHLEIKAKVRRYILQVFNQFAFFNDLSKGEDAGERINDPEKLYLSKDEHALDLYFTACDKAHRDNGFVDLKPGHCPELEAQARIRDAERALLKLAEKFYGIDFNHVSVRDRTLNLIMNPPTV